MGHKPIAHVLIGVLELNTFRFELSHGGSYIVAVKRDVSRARRWAARLCRMAAQVRLRNVEDEPAVADVGGPEAQPIAKERPQLLGLRRIEHGVHATDHD